jgi:hypothetical protein
MPAGYEKMRDAFIRQGMSEDDAKEKAARIWNSKHKGAQAVGRHYDEKNMSALDKIIEFANEMPTVELAVKSAAYLRLPPQQEGTKLAMILRKVTGEGRKSGVYANYAERTVGKPVPAKKGFVPIGTPREGDTEIGRIGSIKDYPGMLRDYESYAMKRKKEIYGGAKAPVFRRS